MSVTSPKSKLWNSLSSVDLASSKETDARKLPVRYLKRSLRIWKTFPRLSLRPTLRSFNGKQSIMREETGQDLERSTRSSLLISRNSAWMSIPLLSISTKTRNNLEQLEKQQLRSSKISSLSSIKKDQRKTSNNCRRFLKKSDVSQSTVMSVLIIWTFQQIKLFQ